MTTGRDFVFVAGARPNFVKIAPILRELGRRGGRPPTLVHTGQHYDFELSGVFFEQLGIPTPDVHLQVGSASHGAQTAAIMSAFEQYLLARARRPDCVVVVGDVNSTMASALVAVKLGIAVVHVEAGLRSFDRTMPEEINRVVTDSIADLMLVSEPAGIENLRREGAPESRVRYVGNVMIDSLVEQLPAARALQTLDRFGLTRRKYALVTLHRPSNVDLPDRLAALVDLLSRLAHRTVVVFPVHPRTNAKLDQLGLRDRLTREPAVRLLAPMGYREFLGLMEGAQLVMSDSGGIQEETTYLDVPCITMRSNTERPVTVSSGTNVLVGNDLELAWNTMTAILGGEERHARPIDGWDGHASVRIVDVLLDPSLLLGS